MAPVCQILYSCYSRYISEKNYFWESDLSNNYKFISVRSGVGDQGVLTSSCPGSIYKYTDHLFLTIMSQSSWYLFQPE